MLKTTEIHLNSPPLPLLYKALITFLCRSLQQKVVQIKLQQIIGAVSMGSTQSVLNGAEKPLTFEQENQNFAPEESIREF